MRKFKIPRKTKKSLKKGLWLYPADEDGNSLMAFPAKNRKDFMAFKKGILRNLATKENSRKRRREFREKLDKEVSVPDETLKVYVNDIMRKDLRISSFQILIEARNKPKAVVAYYNFINAYHLFQNGEESYGNICCLAIDSAKELLKK